MAATDASQVGVKDEASIEQASALSEDGTMVNSSSSGGIGALKSEPQGDSQVAAEDAGGASLDQGTDADAEMAEDAEPTTAAEDDDATHTASASRDGKEAKKDADAVDDEDEPDDAEVNAAIKSASVLKAATDLDDASNAATDAQGAAATPSGDKTTSQAEDSSILNSSTDTSNSPGDAADEQEGADSKPVSAPSKKKSSKKGRSSKKSSSKSRKPSAQPVAEAGDTDAAGDTIMPAEVDDVKTQVEADGTAAQGDHSADADMNADEAGEEDHPEDEGDSGDRSRKKRVSTSGSADASAGTSSHRAASTAKELAYLGLQNLGDGEQEPIMPRRSRRAAFDLSNPHDVEQAQVAADGAAHQGDDDVEGDDQYGDEEADGGDEGVTRCVCGSTDENVGLMIQCEECKCWQHCICMGMEYEDDCPDVYFCEQCKPELHIPLLKQLGVLNENGAFGNHKGNGSSGKKGVIMGPNGKPSKNPARDQARELREAKEKVARLAQENAQRHREAAAAEMAEQEAQPVGTNRKSSYDRSRKRSESHDVDNGQALSIDTASANAAGHGGGASSHGTVKSPKRRNTMNSRDSAYGWEPIPPGLLNDDEVWEDAPVERNSRKRQRSIREEEGEDVSDEEAAPADGTKRRRLSTSRPHDDSEGPSAPRSHKKKSKSRARPTDDLQAPPRPKHPNQYTYRPKVKSNEAPSSAKADGKNEDGGQRDGTPALGRPSSPTPSPSKGRDRRGVAISSSRNGTPVPSSNPGAAWGLPEHLWPLSHYLPAPAPSPLIVHVPSTKGISRGAAAAERNSSRRGGASSSASTSATAAAVADRATPQPFNVLELSESASRVRFPGKRMTMGEMRKRVRNISEFVTRMQLEAVERGRRTAALGIKAGGGLPHDPTRMGLGSATTTAGDNGVPANEDGPSDSDVMTEAIVPADGEAASPVKTAASESEAMEGIILTDQAASAVAPTGTTPEDATAAPASMAASASQLPQSMILLEALTAELLAFQRKFGLTAHQGGGGGGGMGGPVFGASAPTSAISGGNLLASPSPAAGASTSTSGLGLDLGNSVGAPSQATSTTTAAVVVTE